MTVKCVPFIMLLTCFGMTASQHWLDIDAQDLGDPSAAPIQPLSFRSLALDVVALESLLENAPPEGSDKGLLLELPTPDGLWESFAVFVSPIMAPALVERFPNIVTYRAQSLDSHASARLDFTPHGFHAMVRDARGTWYIDPYVPGLPEYAISYFHNQMDSPSLADFQCFVQDTINKRVPNARNAPIEGELLRYRCAIACTGEYASFHGGTLDLAMAAIVTALNRVNQIYENDVAVRMLLVANNDQIVYLDGASDPYTNGSVLTMLGENQLNLDAVIGNANYDIGHVFSIGGGGVASSGVCRLGQKALGVTGNSNPIGDPFYVDYVAHEMGHQFDADHTFNGSSGSCSRGNRNGPTAYEPGSGSTVMAYAGICGAQDLQNNSDPYFHGVSQDQIVAFTRTGSASACAQPLPVENSAATVSAGESYTIPQLTPFALTGSATDPNDDPLTYCWEEFDLGPSGSIGTDNGSSPLFRSWSPSQQPTRTFPRRSDLLENRLAIGEVLPTTDRNLDFRLTVRDNHPGGGGVAFDTVRLTVTTESGPFLVTSPNIKLSWGIGGREVVSWDVASTDSGAVSCTLVDILLSLDGGVTYSELLASNTANDGSELVVVPNLETSMARVKVACTDNIFFDVSNTNFNITHVKTQCTSAFVNWRLPTEGIFLDINGNSVVDIADLIYCIFN